MSSFWDSDRWRQYEIFYGDAPGTRAVLLAGADWKTQTIDLSMERGQLWRDLRKSYHSLIHKVETRVLMVDPSDSLRFSVIARRLHDHCAGHSTRSQLTWQLMSDWAVDGQGGWWTTREAAYPDAASFVAYIYVVIHEDWAYYFSAASTVPNVNHALLWSAMVRLKEMGVRWFELGWQGHATDEKGKQIEFFKRGFGGRCEPARLLAERR